MGFFAAGAKRPHLIIAWVAPAGAEKNRRTDFKKAKTSRGDWTRFLNWETPMGPGLKPETGANWWEKRRQFVWWGLRTEREVAIRLVAPKK